jgi:hypothetical protein
MKWISFLASRRFHSLPQAISFFAMGDFISCHRRFHSCQPAISFLASQQFHSLPASDFIPASQ